MHPWVDIKVSTQNGRWKMRQMAPRGVSLPPPLQQDQLISHITIVCVVDGRVAVPQAAVNGC